MDRKSAVSGPSRKHLSVRSVVLIIFSLNFPQTAIRG
jgi:hypothetical protein